MRPPPRTQAVDRRATLGFIAAAAAALTGAKDAQAAYGDQARVFASTTTNKSGACVAERVALPRARVQRAACA